MDENPNKKKSLLGDALLFAFNGIFENILSWLWMWLSFFGFALLGLVGLVITFVGLKIIIGMMAPGLESVRVSPGFFILGYSLVFIIAMTYIFGLSLAFMRTLIQFYDTHVVKFRPVWSVFKVFSFFIMKIVLWLLIGLGLIAFIIPGILVYLRSMFAVYFLVDKDLGPFASIQASWDLTRGKYNLLLGLAIITFLIGFIPIIGWLGAGLITVYAYRALEKESRLL